MFATTVFIVLALAAFGAQAGPTCPKQDGKFPTYIPHNDCTKFWECSNGTPYLFNCPANLHFNPKLNVCDWPDAAGCRGNNGGNDPGSDSSDSSGSSDSSESSED